MDDQETQTPYQLTPEMESRLEKDFTYHPPKENQILRYQQIRNIGFDVAKYLVLNCPASRELSLALTKLEETIMWANASIARNE